MTDRRGATCAVGAVGPPDAGILSCGAGRSCVPDGGSSSFPDGSPRGRCAPAPAFPARRGAARAALGWGRRALQAGGGGGGGGLGPESVAAGAECPPGCPAEFCACARDGGDSAACAPELDDVCRRDLLSACVPDQWLAFYENTYCPFAACLAVERRGYAECACGYYRNYCDLYYDFETSLEKCAVAACCEREGGGRQAKCLPALQPTAPPTPQPTDSRPPSAPPTASHAPSASMGPSSSQGPSAGPSASGAPSVSAAPTPAPTPDPSGRPSVSMEVSKKRLGCHDVDCPASHLAFAAPADRISYQVAHCQPHQRADHHADVSRKNV